MSWSLLLFTFSGCKFSCCSFSIDHLMACILYLFAFWLEGSVVYCAFFYLSYRQPLLWHQTWQAFLLTLALSGKIMRLLDYYWIINLSKFILSHNWCFMLELWQRVGTRTTTLYMSFATHYFLCHSSDDFCSLCMSFYISASSVKKKYWLTTPILTQKCWWDFQVVTASVCKYDSHCLEKHDKSPNSNSISSGLEQNT